MLINCKTMRPVTMGDAGTTSRYFKEMRKVKPITSEEQLELVRQYAQSNDKNEKIKIRNHLLLVNQAFIVSMARYFTTDDDFNDLISEGNIGMAKAIDSFDIEKGNKFLTYATHYVRKAMVDYKYNTKCMVKPKNTAWVYAYSESAKNKFFMQNGRYPTSEELMDALDENGVSFSNKEDLYDISVHSIDNDYLDGGEENSTSNTWFDKAQIKDSNEEELSNVHEYINTMSVNTLIQQSLSYLSKSEKELICKYYGIGCQQVSSNELAFKNGYGWKPEKIEKEINKIILKIRKHGKIQTEVH